jgi:hypothetical protein
MDKMMGKMKQSIPSLPGAKGMNLDAVKGNIEILIVQKLYGLDADAAKSRLEKIKKVKKLRTEIFTSKGDLTDVEKKANENAKYSVGLFETAITENIGKIDIDEISRIYRSTISNDIEKRRIEQLKADKEKKAAEREAAEQMTGGGNVQDILTTINDFLKTFIITKKGGNDIFKEELNDEIAENINRLISSRGANISGIEISGQTDKKEKIAGKTTENDFKELYKKFIDLKVEIEETEKKPNTPENEEEYAVLDEKKELKKSLVNKMEKILGNYAKSVLEKLEIKQGDTIIENPISTSNVPPVTTSSPEIVEKDKDAEVVEDIPDAQKVDTVVNQAKNVFNTFTGGPTKLTEGLLKKNPVGKGFFATPPFTKVAETLGKNGIPIANITKGKILGGDGDDYATVELGKLLTPDTLETYFKNVYFDFLGKIFQDRERLNVYMSMLFIYHDLNRRGTNILPKIFEKAPEKYTEDPILQNINNILVSIMTAIYTMIKEEYEKEEKNNNSPGEHEEINIVCDNQIQDKFIPTDTPENILKCIKTKVLAYYCKKLMKKAPYLRMLYQKSFIEQLHKSFDFFQQDARLKAIIGTPKKGGRAMKRTRRRKKRRTTVRKTRNHKK